MYKRLSLRDAKDRQEEHNLEKNLDVLKHQSSYVGNWLINTQLSTFVYRTFRIAINEMINGNDRSPILSLTTPLYSTSF